MSKNTKHVNLVMPQVLYEKLIAKLPEKRLMSLIIRQLIREYVNGERVLVFEEFEQKESKGKEE